MNKSTVIGIGVTLAVAGTAYYLLYRYFTAKYAPLISAANAANTFIGDVEHPINTLETWWGDFWGNGSPASPTSTS